MIKNLEMRISSLINATLNATTSVFIREYRGRSDKIVEEKAMWRQSHRVVWPQAKEYWQPQEAERNKKLISLQNRWKERIP